jgi:UDP-N-acetylmuramoyl-L-alanyl-D-glutamate--2,6-diaminopimelate ligase
MDNASKLPFPYKVACHTDNIGKGSTFVAIAGTKENGVVHIAKALEQGATTIVVEKNNSIPDDILECIAYHKAKLTIVANARVALADLSAAALHFPAKRLKIIAITGTKGKTTSTFLLYHLLTHMGYKTALLSTVYNCIGTQKYTAHLTTAQPDYLHHFFAACVEKNIEYVAMEVAAQAETLSRIQGLEFEAVLFTNFSQEHGEFYENLDAYFSAKERITRYRKTDAPLLLNRDNQWCTKLLAAQNSYTFSLQHTDANYYAYKSLQDESPFWFIQYQGTIVKLPNIPGKGVYSVYNTLGVISVLHQLQIPVETAIVGLPSFKSAPGRMQETVMHNGVRFIIDHAHTPSSFEALLSTLREETEHLIVVFGAGGDRDRSKRPIMGAIAATYADTLILTTDNPRSENPYTITTEILNGIPYEQHNKVLVEQDRKEAIYTAYKLAHQDTIVALLGKGSDEYQLCNGIKIDFSEQSIIDSLNQM